MEMGRTAFKSHCCLGFKVQGIIKQTPLDQTDGPGNLEGRDLFQKKPGMVIRPTRIYDSC